MEEVVEVKASDSDSKKEELTGKFKRNLPRYFDDNWRFATYIGAAIVVIFSLILGFSVGRYRINPKYIIPSGNGTRLDGTPWTLLNRPWMLPGGPSASITDTIFGIGVVLALIPVAYVTYSNYRYLD